MAPPCSSPSAESFDLEETLADVDDDDDDDELANVADVSEDDELVAVVVAVVAALPARAPATMNCFFRKVAVSSKGFSIAATTVERANWSRGEETVSDQEEEQEEEINGWNKLEIESNFVM